MDVFDLFAKISLDKSEYDAGLDDASKKSNETSSTLKNSFATAGKVVASGMAAAVSAVSAFSLSSVRAGSDFDSSMSQVAATMGVTVDEIKVLRDYALEMGSKTSFSATQAADALNYMALAGYDAETSMEMLPNVLNLAAAGGIDLASASDMVTDAQSALGLSLDETSEMVDKMAMAASKSNTSVDQLGQAFLTIGGTAKNLVGGTTELATALGILGDNGIKGAEGGTALRNIVLSLSAPTDKARDAMKALGIEAYDADGNLRPLNDIFNDLNDSLSDMTQGEQTQALNEIFNKVDLKSVNALLANSGQRFDELSAYIDEAQGSAEKMANTQLDNLAGDITLFQSALEGAKITLSDELTPSIREFVQFGTDGIAQLADSFSSGGFSGMMETFGVLLSQLIEKIISMLPQITEAGAKLLGALAEGIIQNLPLLIESALQIILQLATSLAQALPTMIPTIVDIVLTIVDNLIDNVDLLIDASLALIVGLAEGLIEALPKLLEKAPVIVEKLVMAIANNAPKLLQSALQLIVSLVQGIVSNLPKVVNAGIDVVLSIIKGIVQMFGNLVMKGKDIVDSVKDGFKQKVDDAKNWGKDLISNFIGGIKDKWNDLKTSVSNVASTVKSYLGFSEPEKGPLSNFHTYAPDMIDLFTKGIKDNEGKLTAQIEKTFDFENAFNPPVASIDAVSSAGNSEESRLFALLNEYLPMLANMQIVMDSGELVGAIAEPIDEALGEMLIRKERSA